VFGGFLALVGLLLVDFLVLGGISRLVDFLVL